MSKFLRARSLLPGPLLCRVKILDLYNGTLISSTVTKGQIVQTFLPYPDFEETARVLDYRRLGKQRVETWQLIRALNGETKGWVNHPAARMWDGYESTLAYYGMVICEEWRRRGYKDQMLERLAYEWERLGKNLVMPPWMGNSEFHTSHQSNLVRKLPEHYSPIFTGVPDDLEYVWPTV